ncbi:MAG: hypothetical protein QM785_12150 [Pyrinomonadaceae bacterium]
MKKGVFIVWALLYLAAFAIAAKAQGETFTGTIIATGSGRNVGTRTANFTLTLKGQTSTDDAQRYLTTLQTNGQSALLEGIKNEDLGTLQVGGQLGRTLNVVRERNIDGKRKIYVLFERWTEFAELRGGYRSLDYPFGYVELTIDPRTGNGEGKYFAAAKVRMKKSKDSGVYNVEVEDYATFPAKLVQVKSEGKRM